MKFSSLARCPGGGDTRRGFYSRGLEELRRASENGAESSWSKESKSGGGCETGGVKVVLDVILCLRQSLAFQQLYGLEFGWGILISQW